MLRKFTIYLSLLFLSQSLFAEESPVLHIKALSGPVDLVPYIRFLCVDTETELESIQKESFRPLAKGVVNLGFKDEACWLKVELQSLLDQPEVFVMNFEFPLLDQVDLFVVRGEDIERSYLGDIRLNDRDLKLPVLASQTMLEPDERATLFYRIQSGSRLSIKLWIDSSASFMQRLSSQIVSACIVYGMFITIAFISITAFFISRYSPFFYLACFVFIALMLMIILDGFGPILWPDAVQFQNNGLYIFVCLVNVSYLMMSRGYLELYNNRLQNTIILAFCSLLLLLVPFAYILPLKSISILIPSLTGVGTGYVIVMSVILTLNHHVNARYHLFGSCILFSIVAHTVLNSFSGSYIYMEMLTYFKTAFFLQVLCLYWGITQSYRDIRKQQKQLAQMAVQSDLANKAKSEFLATMSHEIRNPLNGVMGVMDLLKDTSIDKEQSHLINSAKNAGSILLNIINDILDFSKIEAGKLELECIPVDLYELIEETHSILQPISSSKGLELTFTIDDSCPRYVMADSTRLRQIITNFVSNAVKFTPSGSVQISAKSSSSLNQNILIEVVDTGIGISEENIGKLFKSFQQADASTTREYGGTGLGLSICKRLVELMGGVIGVDSKLGSGSNFWFEVNLPIIEKNVVEAQLSVGDTRLATGFNYKTILVADDNAVNRLVISGMLKKQDVTAVVVEDGQQALTYYQNNFENVDLILMDCEMPILSGWDAVQKIRAFEKEEGLGSTPVVALTGHATKEYYEKAISVGMNDRITKPIAASSLVEVLAKYNPS